MVVTIELTAHHRGALPTSTPSAPNAHVCCTRPAGWFEFRLAVLDDPDKSVPITQELLNEHVLEIDPSTIDYERVTDYQAVRASVRCPSSGGHSDPSAAALTATFPHGSCCNGGGACTPPDANRDRYVVDDAAFGNTY